MSSDDWLSDFFLGHEGRQQRDIQALQSRVASVSSVADRATALERRADRLELVCHALLEIIQKREIATADEIAVVIAQIDLRDGLEDGALREGTRRSAPLCAACQRPINPARSACVYCDAPITAPAGAPKAARPPRMVTCAKCQKVIDERETYFTGAGLRCEACFHGA